MGGLEVVRSRTNEQGIATFDWMPPEVAKAVPFLVSARSDYSCPDTPAYQPASGSLDLEARLLSHTRISGVVRLADGQPAPRILVQAEGRGETNHYCRLYTRTGADGSYSLDVYPDQWYMIAIIDRTWAAQSLSGVLVREGQRQDGLDIRLVEGTLIEGKVIKGNEHAPVAGASITLIQTGEPLPQELTRSRREEASVPRWESTDAEGRYRFRVGRGRYELRGPNRGSSEKIEVRGEPGIVRDFSVDAEPVSRPLTGRAIEKMAAGERPLADAIVEAMWKGRVPKLSATQKGASKCFETRARGLSTRGTVRAPRPASRPSIQKTKTCACIPCRHRRSQGEFSTHPENRRPLERCS